MRYSEHFSTKVTPQSQPIPGKEMVENSAGGFVFQTDSWVQFERFLILGTEGGTYYAKEKKLTIENAKNTIACIQKDGPRVVRELVQISSSGRAAKNGPAIFALALCVTFGSQETKKESYSCLVEICRTGTHLFEFCQAIKDLRGWSRGLRTAVANWYLKNDKVAYQLIKYRQRNGWTHRDVLRLCHAKAKDPVKNELLKWAVGKKADSSALPGLVIAMESLSHTKSVHAAGQIIVDNHLPREAVPTELLKHKEIWEALLHKMPLMAMIRNLGVMTAKGVVTSNFDASTRDVIQKLNLEAIRRSKVHPMHILTALKIYAQGRGMKGKLSWSPVPKIVDALDDAFYMAFENVRPTNKNFLIGLDVSGSMDSPVLGLPLSAREATAAMSLVMARTEPSLQIFCFSNYPLNFQISEKSRLEDLLKATRGLPFQGTDCSLPMRVATIHRLPIDVFMILTDNETWAGDIHPKQALDEYRQTMGRDAKCIVVGTTATNFTIADPSDKGMLDVVGFDSSIPEIIRKFVI